MEQFLWELYIPDNVFVGKVIVDWFYDLMCWVCRVITGARNSTCNQLLFISLPGWFGAPVTRHEEIVWWSSLAILTW